MAELVALPEVPGGALATIVERDSEPPTPLRNSLTRTVSSFPSASPGNMVRDLTALATFSASLSSDHLEQSIEQSLEWIRQTVDAEAAELFLMEPRGRDMLLSGYQGLFRSAFSEKTRFHPGEGFPGLVLSRGEPISTRSLPEDPRYLRSRVKKKGFNSYVCVPIPGPGGIIGVLNVATRRPDLDLERTLRFLTWTSQPLSAVLQAGLFRAIETFGAEPGNDHQDADQNLDGLLRAVLHQMMLMGKATGGALLLYDRNVQGVVRRVTEGEFSGVLCPDIRTGTPKMCPALVGGHGMALQNPRYLWPSACQNVPAGTSMVYCLPLVAGSKQEVGVVQLGYTGRSPSPPTKYLASLLNLADVAAPAIRLAWMNLQNQQLAQSRLSALEQVVGQEAAHGDSQFQLQEQKAHSLDTGTGSPFLEIRCFGAFELYRQGKLVTSDMFPRRGALTLLKILLMFGGRPVPRDSLAEILWPEADPQASANRLYVLAHTLRRVLEPLEQDQNWVFIRSDGDLYYFNPEAPYRLDLEDFKEFVRLGERQERQGDTTAAIDAYESALNLYRGDLFEQEPYAEWCWEEREHLKEICLTVLRRLAAFYLDRNAPNESIERYRQALRIDSLREENYRGLMEALWLAKRRDEALREYQVCKDVLQRELEVEPLPETEQLYLFIRNNYAP